MTRGFTLIELLIVIVLLGLAIALVGPLTVEQVENARARNEQQKLVRWLQKQSFTAFARQQTHIFMFDGKAVYQQVEGDIEPLLVAEFDYLFFPPQQLSVNYNGYMQPDSLAYSVKGREQRLSLSDMQAEKHER